MHLADDLAFALEQVGRGVGAVALARIGQCGGDEGGVALGEPRGRLVEVAARDGLNAVDAVAGLGHVEVHLEDTLLAPNVLDEDGEVNFEALAQPTVAVPQKDVLGRLLTDGAGAALPLAALRLVDGLTDGLEVESVVLQEILVLAGDYSLAGVVAYLVERDPLVVETRQVAVHNVTHGAREHQRREVDRHPTPQHHSEQCAHKEKDDRVAQPQADENGDRFQPLF